MKNNCPVEALLKIIGQRWSAYIVWTVTKNGVIRFGKLKKQIPNISQKVLTEKLRELEKHGIINRDYKNTIPPTVSYSITPKAQELVPILSLIDSTAHKWRKEGRI